jgi:prevent-host-death family protein
MTPSKNYTAPKNPNCTTTFFLVPDVKNDYHDYSGHRGLEVGMSTHRWTVAEAKAKFSEVIDRAESDGPQTITRNGRTTAVIVAASEWERKTKRKGTLADFFAASPLRGSGVQIKRLRGRVRKVDL